MSSRLPHVTRIFEQGLEGGSSEAQETDRLGEQDVRDRQPDRVLRVSRQEDVMLGWANLFASAVFGPSGEFREGRIRRHE